MEQNEQQISQQNQAIRRIRWNYSGEKDLKVAHDEIDRLKARVVDLEARLSLHTPPTEAQLTVIRKRQTHWNKQEGLGPKGMPLKSKPPGKKKPETAGDAVREWYLQREQRQRG